MDQRLTAILPCNDLDAAEAFFSRLGFKRDPGSLDEYRMLSDGLGGFIHLNRAVQGWLQSGRNPFGLYLYREDVDGAAAAFAGVALANREPIFESTMRLDAVDGPKDRLRSCQALAASAAAVVITRP